MTAKQRQPQYLRILEVSGVAITDAILNQRRLGKSFAWARLCLVAAVRKNHPSWSNLTVARYVGRKDASTILYSVRRFDALIQSNPEFRQFAESCGVIGESNAL